jgi:hypothetical protein
VPSYTCYNKFEPNTTFYISYAYICKAINTIHAPHRGQTEHLHADACLISNCEEIALESNGHDNNIHMKIITISVITTFTINERG